MKALCVLLGIRPSIVGWKWIFGCSLSIILVCPAFAHLIVANTATVNIKPEAAYLVISLPVSAFVGLPQKTHGLIHPSDIPPHQALIETQLRQHLSLRLARDAPPQTWQLLLLNPSLGDHAPLADQIIGFIQLPWEKIPDALWLDFRLWGSLDKKALKITVHEGEHRDQFVVNSHQPTLNLRPSAIEVGWHFFLSGMHHIAEGWDHLLFLSLLLLYQVSYRRWFWLLTSFTIAHACSYGLVSWGIFPAPNQWVETAIAATIAWSALPILLSKMAPPQNVPITPWAMPYALFRKILPRTYLRAHKINPIGLPPSIVSLGKGITRKFSRLLHPDRRYEYLLVMVFGAIHGLGFANAAIDQGINARYPGFSLVGFNMGLESGQLMLAAVMGLLIALSQPLRHLGWTPTLSHGMKLSVAGAGFIVSVFWMVTRWGN